MEKGVAVITATPFCKFECEASPAWREAWEAICFVVRWCYPFSLPDTNNNIGLHLVCQKAS